MDGVYIAPGSEWTGERGRVMEDTKLYEAHLLPSCSRLQSSPLRSTVSLSLNSSCK